MINVKNNVSSITTNFKYNSEKKINITITNNIQDVFSNSKCIFVYENECIKNNNIIFYLVKTAVEFEYLATQYKIDRRKIGFTNNVDDIIEKYVTKNKYEFFSYLLDLQYLKSNDDRVTIEYKNEKVVITSILPEDKYCYVTLANEYIFTFRKNIEYEIGCNGIFQENFDFSMCLKVDDHKKNIINENFLLNRKLKIKFDKDYNDIKILLRIKGSGKLVIDNIYISDVTVKSKEKDYLVLTNIYPSYDNLYRNGFVHSRVLSYRENDVECDVFTPTQNKYNGFYDFEGITINFGNYEKLTEFLNKNIYKKILIHFVDKNMIKAIEESNFKGEIIIWIHGYETERWNRRLFNYTKEEIKANQKEWELKDDLKMAFMRDIYTNPKIKFIFVSEWFKESVAEIDTECMVLNSVVIPNPINEKIFNFKQKDLNMRKKILTIRPFASKKYANDLTVKAILELSKEAYFDELEFSIYGKGKLFDEILEPIQKFKNVKIFNTFLQQKDIAKLHKENGVFICPTRLDAQGVSMCEAMSSGLVVISNDCTAIPEYVPENCGILAPENDFKLLAEGIKSLYNNPEKFLKMSDEASDFIRKTCSTEIVIKKELEEILR